MTLQNAKVLHKHFKDKGMLAKAQQLEKRYPQLIIKQETKKNGKKSKR